MDIIKEQDKHKLYNQVLHMLGAPAVSVELREPMMDSYLEMAVSEYEQYVHDWLIESQWSSLYGINVDEQSVARAFTSRSLDYESQYTFAYSKIVGLQARGPWELQKDYITLSGGTQMYEIPAGREVNELLWFSRSEANEIMLDPLMGGFGGLGGTLGGGYGMAQVGGIGGGNYFMMPAFDILLRMQDRNIKNRLIGGDLTYRITAGPEGKKFIHLYNVPGGRFDFGNIQRNYHVWYWYYDTNDREACLKENPDVAKLPSDIQTEALTWDTLNAPGRTWVRKFFIALCKEGLGRIRGKFGGELKVPGAEVKLDADSLLTEGKDERLKLVEELMQRLERLRPDKMLERKGNEAENLNKSLKYRPFQSPFNPI
jgi:hypothetical protein